EAGIGKTTLLDAWTRARRAGGDLVLSGTCRPLDRTAPLDVVLTAVADHLRGSPDVAALLGPEAGTLAPLLGLSAGAAGEQRGVDPALGPATLFAAVTAVLARIAGPSGAILVIDDAHLAGQAFADWLAYVLRRPIPILVAVGVRPAEGPDLPATDEIGLGPLDRAQVAELVGPDRADDLYDRSGGHPLFLSELAAVPAGELPPSLVAAVSSRCDQLGTAGDLVRAAAVIGDLDVELLAAVLNRRALHVLADVELAEQQGLLVEDAGRHRFRHELAREALVTGTTPGRRALLHREAGRVLAGRPAGRPCTARPGGCWPAGPTPTPPWSPTTPGSVATGRWRRPGSGSRRPALPSASTTPPRRTSSTSPWRWSPTTTPSSPARRSGSGAGATAAPRTT
uniref:AAA family ATPase n=1 Tax=Nocardioides pelophilus TaxID=2172019 RepID=UPI0015FEEBBE